MPATIDITQAALLTLLGNFFQGILGNDPATGVLVPVVVGQPNRVPMPTTAYILMQPNLLDRLSTNVLSFDPVAQTQKSQQNTKLRVQLDIYGPLAFDWAQMLATLWRDRYGCDALKPTCQPLYHDAPFNAPLVAGEEQYESRWTLNLFLQYNPVTTTALQSATALSVKLYNVDEKYQP